MSNKGKKSFLGKLMAFRFLAEMIGGKISFLQLFDSF